MENLQQDINYNRIAKAIQFILDNFDKNLSLDDIAAHVHLSPFHFQRIFTAWAGTSPKKFMQYLQLDYAKQLLKEEKKSIFDTHILTGVGSTSRLHDLFIQVEGMSPATYKKAGEGLKIKYSFQESIFGKCLIASTEIGVCFMAFIDSEDEGLKELKASFNQANFEEGIDPIHIKALSILNPEETQLEKIKLHLKGTEFQLKVWQALLSIPSGEVRTYKQLASAINHPKAYRAVGTAIGQNPIAFLIPCHRVIQASGHFGGYKWQPLRKTVILGWEQANYNQ